MKNNLQSQIDLKDMHFTMEEIINFTETWIVKGDLNPDILADNFQFISPFWESNDKATF